MKPLKIRLIGDPVLQAQAKPVPVIDESIRELSAAMLDAMYTHHGIGLAGNQVGVLKQIVVIDIEPEKDDEGNVLPVSSPGEAELLPKMPVTLINPEIVSSSDDKCPFDEGCLSVPKLYANVMRPSRVVLKSQLLDGSRVMLECGGLLARVLQHEIDHLHGRVFVQIAEEEDYQKIASGVDKIIRKSGQKNFKVKRLI